MTKDNQIKVLKKQLRDLRKQMRDLQPVVTEFYRLQNKAGDVHKKMIKLVYGPEIYKAIY